MNVERFLNCIFLAEFLSMNSADGYFLPEVETIEDVAACTGIPAIRTNTQIGFFGHGDQVTLVAAMVRGQPIMIDTSTATIPE